MIEPKWNKQIPVYLFTGFLESGKTSFIKDSLKEVDFVADDRNLCIMTERGMTSMSKEEFPGVQLEIEMVTDKANFNREYLTLLNDRHTPDKILLECNGMWMLQDIYDNLPDNWVVAQEFSFADANTFMMFNSNMRNLVYDKLQFADLVAFNRCDESMKVMDYHKIVRVANRNCQIVYEMKNGQIKVDDIVDPLPFDENADFIDLEDRNFAYWFRDYSENPGKYDGRQVRFLAMTTIQGVAGIADFGAGRHVMTCCIDDIEFMGLYCKNNTPVVPEERGWYYVTGTVQPGPIVDGEETSILSVSAIEPAEKPEEPVATFY